MAKDNRSLTPAEVMRSIRINGDDLPSLTDKQMAFVMARAEGKNASQAYRESHDTSNSKPTTVSANACRLDHNPKIQEWLTAMKQAHLGAATLTRDHHMRELERLRELGVVTGDLKSAVKAEEVRGYVAGLRVERAEITINDPAAILQQIRAINPKIAEQLAHQYAIPVAPVIEHEPSATEVSD